MEDRADLRRVREDVVLAVGDDRVVVPGALPQLVEDVEVLVGPLEPVVVLDLALEAVVARGVGQVRRDDVPADPALGQVVEGRGPAGPGERRLVGRGEGDAEAEVLGHRGHGGYDDRRVVVRDLQPLPDRGVGRSPEGVVGADHVGEEHRVEAAGLEQLGQLGPVLDVVEPLAVVVRQPPQAVGDVADAVHLEQVEDQRASSRRVTAHSPPGRARTHRGSGPPGGARAAGRPDRTASGAASPRSTRVCASPRSWSTGMTWSTKSS